MPAEEDLPGRLVVNWFKSLANPCLFAKNLLPKIRPFTFLPGIPPADELVSLADQFLLRMAQDSVAALFVFPSVRTDAEIVELLSSLATGPRFTLVEFQWPNSKPRSEVLVGLEWETPRGHRSRAMGLAPSGNMPVTRRAPFVSILVWPGGHENPHRQEDYRTVGVADMQTSVSHEQYEQWWEQTKAEKTERCLLEPSSSAAFREVAFCLDAQVRGGLVFNSAVPSAISTDQW